MKRIAVITHHRSAGGKPLDSLWFSRNFCQKEGVKLEFYWTNRGINLLKFTQHQQILFDGAFALINYQGPLFYYSSQLFKKQVAVYWHETEFRIEDAFKKQLRAKVIQNALDNHRVFHFHVCQYGVKMLHERYGVKKENLQVLNNISDDSRLLRHQLPLPSEPRLFVACGAVSKRKGVDLFLDIACRVTDRQAKFIWIGKFGSGSFSEETIKQEVCRRGLNGKVFFMGAMPDPTEMIAKASTFILTSRDDPMPKVLMEALALGKHCVAFGVSGVPELLGQFGTIISPGDTEAFADALQVLPDEDESIQSLRRQWYLQQYSPAAFGYRFPQAVEQWDRSWES